jgi:hypothetical protein
MHLASGWLWGNDRFGSDGSDRRWELLPQRMKLQMIKKKITTLSAHWHDKLAQSFKLVGIRGLRFGA